MKNYKLILKSQQRFRSETHNVFTEEINKIALRLMMIKEYNQLIQQKDMHIERGKIQYVRKKKLKVNI